MLGCVSLSWIAARIGRKCRSPSVRRWRCTRSCSEADTKKYSCRRRNSRPGRGFIARIEDLGDRLRARLLDQRADVIAAVEGVEPHRIDRAGGPQPQRIHVAAAPSHDRRVVGDRLDGLVGTPDRAGMAARKVRGLDAAAEMDVVDHLRPRELPGVAERQPFLRIFLLPAVPDDLAKQSVIVADAVAVGGDPEARHALHEAGGEPAEAAVAERRVGLGGSQPVEVHAEIAERGAEARRPGRDCTAHPPAAGRSGTPARGSRPACCPWRCWRAPRRASDG